MIIIRGELRGYDGPNNMVKIHTERGNDISMPVLNYELQEDILDNLFTLSGVMLNWEITEGNVTGYRKGQ